METERSIFFNDFEASAISTIGVETRLETKITAAITSRSTTSEIRIDW